MGFDNECVLNITSLPGEYFCPVCRTLICPKEALQAQCTHLYCKPCLSYVVATTQACPYDGYLVTEADSKPLMESNKFLAETVGKVGVHCLYHKSGCQYQGQLSDCITHGTTCAYGNSPVVCNRCGTQIVHRQVQEHAHLCPGQPQTQQAGSSLTQSTTAVTQAVTQYPYAANSTAPSVAAAAAPTTAVPSAVATSSAGASATTTSMVAVPPSSVATPIATSQGQAIGPQTPTAEQYQQQLQYQQYYQQNYPGHNPYMQQYQQYGQYQQYTQSQIQVAPQNVAQPPAQSALYVQPQVLQPSQPQQMVPSHSQNQPGLPQLQAPAVQPHPQHNPPLQSAPQIPQMQPQSQVPLQVPHPQAHSMAHPPASTQVGSQPFAIPATQATPSQVQPHAQPHPPEYQQVHSQQQHLQLQHLPQQQHVQSHIQLNSQFQHQHPYPQPQTYYQPHPMAHAQPHPPAHAVANHQSYPQPQPAQDTLQGAPLQHPVHASQQQVIGSQQPAPVRPSQSQVPLQGQQSTMPPQGTQPTPQKHAGSHAQMPPMHPSIPSEARQPGIPLNTQDREDSSDKGKINNELAGWESNSHVQGHKESKASDTSNDPEKRGSLQQASQQNLGPLGSSSMGAQHPAGPDRILPHNMLHPGSMPYVQGQPNQMRPPMNKFPENIRLPMQQQPYGSNHSEMAPRAPVPNQNQTSILQPVTIRADDGMIRPPMGGPFPGQHDTTVPPFASEYLARPYPLETGKSNSFGVGPHASSRTYHEAGVNSSQEHFRSFAAYPGRHNGNLKDTEENIKEFPGPTRLEREGAQWGPRPFEGNLGRPEGFANPLPGRPPFSNQPGSHPIGLFQEFSRIPHSPDGMPTLRNAGGHGGPREYQPYSGNLPGNVQHDFRSPEFPHPRFPPGDGFVPRNLHGGGPLGHVHLRGMEPPGYHYQGHMQQDDHFAIDYSRRGFQNESGHFGSDGHLRNGDDGWCRICNFNCGSIENLELHVYTGEHQQCAMDIVLKMKHDTAKNHNINPGGYRSFSKKVVGKGNVRGNRR